MDNIEIEDGVYDPVTRITYYGTNTNPPTFDKPATYSGYSDCEVVKDVVNHPPHYISETGLETIDVIEAFTFDLKGIEAVATGNVIKYICRWKQKNGLQDLKKAQWYLNKLINHVEKIEKENVELRNYVYRQHT